MQQPLWPSRLPAGCGEGATLNGSNGSKPWPMYNPIHSHRITSAPLLSQFSHDAAAEPDRRPASSQRSQNINNPARLSRCFRSMPVLAVVCVMAACLALVTQTGTAAALAQPQQRAHALAVQAPLARVPNVISPAHCPDPDIILGPDGWFYAVRSKIEASPNNIDPPGWDCWSAAQDQVCVSVSHSLRGATQLACLLGASVKR